MTYPITVVTEPAEEPVTLDEIKAQTRVDIDDDDDLLTAQAIAAREMCELRARRAFVTQTLAITLDAWPRNRVIQLPRPPLQSVTSVTYIDEDGDSGTLSSDAYIVDTARGRITLKAAYNWPTAVLRAAAAITVTFVAGYGHPVDVPERYKAAIKLLVAHWYENREAVMIGAGLAATPLPEGVKVLLGVDRGSFF